MQRYLARHNNLAMNMEKKCGAIVNQVELVEYILISMNLRGQSYQHVLKLCDFQGVPCEYELLLDKLRCLIQTYIYVFCRF